MIKVVKAYRLLVVFRFIFQEGKYVRAMYDYITQESTLLNFKKGDVVKVIDKPDLEIGWLFGVCAGRTGYFPTEYVTRIKEVRQRFCFGI